MPLRLRYLAFGATVVLLGLLVHLRGTILPSSVRDIAGDVLWAMMMTAWLSSLVPRTQPVARYAAALAVCFVVEWSQLWSFPFLDAARSTFVGRLVLGSGFDPRDFAAYTAGVVLAVAIDGLWIMRER